MSEGKITGEEDRYSGTDLWDFAANVAGSKAAFDALAPALKAKADPELLQRIQTGFQELDANLAKLEKGDGYVLYCQQGDELPVEPVPEADGHEGPGQPAEGAARRAVRGPRPGARSARPRLVSHPGSRVVFPGCIASRCGVLDLGDRTPPSPMVCVLASRAIRSGNPYETSEAGH